MVVGSTVVGWDPGLVPSSWGRARAPDRIIGEDHEGGDHNGSDEDQHAGGQDSAAPYCTAARPWPLGRHGCGCPSWVVPSPGRALADMTSVGRDSNLSGRPDQRTGRKFCWHPSCFRAG